MDIKEYREAVNRIEETARKAKADLSFAYAVNNNPHKKGDTITDGSTTIQIHESDVRIHSDEKSPGTPVCVFRGPQVTEDGELDNDGVWKEIWQPNIKNNLDN
jgi:hypothetical protein